LLRNEKYYFRGLQEEVAEKQEHIVKMGQEIEAYRGHFNQCTEQIKKMSRDMDAVKTKTIDAKIKVRDLTAVIEMEAPSLQMKMDEIREIEAEINSLEEKIQVGMPYNTF
jgi:uncharacterized coiled-coil DUF342 family protein